MSNTPSSSIKASPVSRRDFVKDASVVLGAFTIVPRHVLGRGYRAPSDTLNIACIGVGGMGYNDVRGVASENVYALCDVDDLRGERAFREWTKAKRYRDFRQMLEKEPSIDAVTVSTPDHTHAAAAMMALKMGKHVYCQKPLARTVGEVRALKQEAARRPKQVTQMGNQGHAAEGMRLTREVVDSGAIGTVHRVEFWTNRPIWPQGVQRPTEAHNVPPTLDWDLWLGPAKERPYHPGYAPFAWRGWWDFGTGAMGDMACHIMDASFWTLGLKYPSRVIPESSTLFAESAPKASRITYEFPARGEQPAVTLVWRDGGLYPARPDEYGMDRAWPPDPEGGALWVGDKGKLVAGTYGGDPQLTDPAKNEQLKAQKPPEKYPRIVSAPGEPPPVYKEWITAIKSGTQPGSNFATHAGPLTEMIVLGNLAVRAGRTIELDPETGAIRTPGIPDEWVTPRYRAGWVL